MIKLNAFKNLKGLAGMGKAMVLAHRPELLFGASVVATLGAVAASGKAGFDSGVQIAEEVVGHEIKTEEISTKAKLQLTWMNYLPTAGLTAAALGSTTGLHLVHVKEKKQLVAAGLMALEELRENEQAMQFANRIGLISDEEEARILEERAAKNNGKAVTYVGDGVIEELYRVKDEFTGRVFWSTKEKVDAAVNKVNEALNKNGDCDINTFYMWAGIEELDRGIETGWSGELVTLKWEDTHDDNNRPVRQFMFQPQPRKGYDDTNA